MTNDEQAVIRAAQEQIQREVAGLQQLTGQIDDGFLQTVEILQACRGKVFVTGSGTSGAVARRMAHLLSVCGTPSVFISAMDALHGTMGAMSAGGVLTTISRGGETYELNELSSRVKEWNIPVIALTADDRSTLAGLADVVVTLEVGPEADPGGVIAMGSTLGVAIWGDALATVLMRVKDYGWDQMLYTHPAGAVGKITEEPNALEGLTMERHSGIEDKQWQ